MCGNCSDRISSKCRKMDYWCFVAVWRNLWAIPLVNRAKSGSVRIESSEFHPIFVCVNDPLLSVLSKPRLIRSRRLYSVIEQHPPHFHCYSTGLFSRERKGAQAEQTMTKNSYSRFDVSYNIIWQLGNDASLRQVNRAVQALRSIRAARDRCDRRLCRLHPSARRVRGRRSRRSATRRPRGRSRTRRGNRRSR